MLDQQMAQQKMRDSIKKKTQGEKLSQVSDEVSPARSGLFIKNSSANIPPRR